MVASLLFSIAALATMPGDNAFTSFSSLNPSQGTLGTWTYGYFEPGDVFVQLPNQVNNTPYRLKNWQLGTNLSTSQPRVTRNIGTTDKTYIGASYPSHDYLVLKPKNTNAVVVRFTADAAATYTFDTHFRAVRVSNPSSTLVSLEQAGVTLNNCAGAVNGLLNGVGAELLCVDTVVHLDAGQTVDFVVDSNGSTANYDDIGLSVAVTMEIDVDTDGDGLLDSDEALLGTDPNNSDSDSDGLSDGAEVNTHGTNPLQSDTDGGGVSDGIEVSKGGNPRDASDDQPGDDLEASFAGYNPDVGTLGEWSYGYYAPGDVFTLLSHFSRNTTQKLESWAYGVTAGAAPRVTNNYRVTSKVWSNVHYPAEDVLVVRPRVNLPVVVSFTADTNGDYRFDTTFKSMRTARPGSTLVSVEHDGAVVDACQGSVTGLFSSVAGNQVSCNAAVSLEAGDSVEFVVDSNGPDAYDEVGLSVAVYATLHPPDLTDTDLDGLIDTDEALLGTDPTNPDTDTDGLTDGAEVHTHGTDPLDPDSDGDGLSDGAEVNTHGTSPTDSDSDDDGLSDSEEVLDHGTYPNDADSDDDGYSDFAEIDVGTDPTDPTDYPGSYVSQDSDWDYVDDAVEIAVGSNPFDSDSDNDGLDDYEEIYLRLTSPIDSDTDDDGLWDMDEIYSYLTDPLDYDSDDGGASDGAEIGAGTDPNDALDDFFFGCDAFSSFC